MDIAFRLAKKPTSIFVVIFDAMWYSQMKVDPEKGASFAKLLPKNVPLRSSN